MIDAPVAIDRKVNIQEPPLMVGSLNLDYKKLGTVDAPPVSDRFVWQQKVESLLGKVNEGVFFGDESGRGDRNTEFAAKTLQILYRIDKAERAGSLDETQTDLRTIVSSVNRMQNDPLGELRRNAINVTFQRALERTGDRAIAELEASRWPMWEETNNAVRGNSASDVVMEGVQAFFELSKMMWVNAHDGKPFRSEEEQGRVDEARARTANVNIS